jgi:hypothetical protein
MAYPTTDWPVAVDAAVVRTNLVDVVDADDFNYPDEQIRAIQTWLGASGDMIGDTGVATEGAAGMVSPVASGGVAFKFAARANYVAGKLLSIVDNYDAAPAELFAVDHAGIVTAGGMTLAGSTTVTSVLDEDTLVSDSNTALATQQSIKAYVDAANYWSFSGVEIATKAAIGATTVALRGSAAVRTLLLDRTDRPGLPLTVGEITARGRDNAWAVADFATISMIATNYTAGTEAGKVVVAVANGTDGAVDKVLEITTDGSWADPGHYDEVQTVTSSSNAVAVDCQNGFNIYHVLTENTAFGVPSNAEDGMIIRFFIVGANGSTGYTPSFNTGAGGYWLETYPGAIAENDYFQISFRFEVNINRWLEMCQSTVTDPTV